MLIPAGKANNLYEQTTDDYNKLLIENISKANKNSDFSTIRSINGEAKLIAQYLNIDQTLEQYNQNQSFITLKDHKENFKGNHKCMLINPARSEVGIVIKEYVENIRKTRDKKCKPMGKHRCSSYMASQY